MTSPFKRGDFVRYRSREAFRGMVLETWKGFLDSSWRASIVWENGKDHAVSQERDLLAGEPFTTPKFRAALKARLASDRARAATLAERVAWLEGFLKRKK